MPKLYIPVILGTAREGRASEQAAQFVLKQTEVAGFETELIDVRDHPSPSTARIKNENYDAGKALEKIQRADGYLIVAPEYNHGYPGELKIFLDHFYPEFAKKPFGLCGVSMGPSGGIRMVENLRPVLAAFDAPVMQRAVQFANVSDGIDQEKYAGLVDGLLEQLGWYASALKTAREA